MGSRKYVDQSAHSLRLTLCNGRLDQSQFTILERGWCKVGDMAVEAAIVGGSHFLTVEHSGQVFSEVCVCMPFKHTGKVYLDEPLYSVEGFDSRTVEGTPQSLVYGVRRRVVAWDKADSDMKELLSRVNSSSRENVIALVHDFPRCKGDSRDPRTVVSVVRVEGGLSVSTIHSYPQEDLVVFTDSLFSPSLATSRVK